ENRVLPLVNTRQNNAAKITRRLWIHYPRPRQICFNPFTSGLLSDQERGRILGTAQNRRDIPVLECRRATDTSALRNRPDRSTSFPNANPASGIIPVWEKKEIGR